jgi:RNA polymerase sigma-70 factor, ECF subfamily
VHLPYEELDLRLPIEEFDDAYLVGKIVQRDQEALMALYSRYSSRVYTLIFRMVREQMAAEEILQDVFVRLWNQPDRYTADRGQLLSWLFAIARNAALDFRRRETRRSRLAPTESISNPAPSIDLQQALVSDSLLKDPEVVAAVRQALAQLPTAQRELLELSFYEGLSHSEITQRTGEALGTVKTRIRLGMGKLRDVLRVWGQPV